MIITTGTEGMSENEILKRGDSMEAAIYKPRVLRVFGIIDIIQGTLGSGLFLINIFSMIMCLSQNYPPLIMIGLIAEFMTMPVSIGLAFAAGIGLLLFKKWARTASISFCSFTTLSIFLGFAVRLLIIISYPNMLIISFFATLLDMIFLAYAVTQLISMFRKDIVDAFNSYALI